MKLIPQKHYHLVEDNVGRPLIKFKNTQELIQVLADVIEGVCLPQAWAYVANQEWIPFTALKKA